MRSTIPEAEVVKIPDEQGVRAAISRSAFCVGRDSEIEEAKQSSTVPSPTKSVYFKASPPRGLLSKALCGVTNASKDILSKHSYLVNAIIYILTSTSKKFT